MKSDFNKFKKPENILIKRKSISYGRDANMLDDSCDSKDICCQYIKQENREVYYIKKDSLNNLYNPMDERVNKRCNLSIKMKTVGEDCFMSYLDFLISKKEKDYRIANRKSLR